MQITTYGDVTAFLDRVQPTLMQQETLHSLLIGIALNVQKDPGRYGSNMYMATVDEEEELVLAALMTLPFYLVLASVHDNNQAAIDLLVRHTLQRNWPLPGVIGMDQTVDAFAATWEQLSGHKAKPDVFQYLYELTEVTAPRPVPGRLRLATEADAPTIGNWSEAFFAEALPNNPAHEGGDQYALRRIVRQEIYVWELPDGQLASMAAIGRSLPHTASVGLVYTPPELRGAGYASNCVAALSQHILDSGKTSSNLFADMANPTSNGIYQKIGYRLLGELHEYVFASSETPSA